MHTFKNLNFLSVHSSKTKNKINRLTKLGIFLNNFVTFRTELHTKLYKNIILKKIAGFACNGQTSDVKICV